MSENEGNGSVEMERLQLYTTQLKIVALNNRVEAMKQRQQAINMEAAIIPDKLKAAEEEGKRLIEIYRSGYDKLKETMEVPEGKEVNLETGELVDAQQQ
jgi:hypothetical protein